MLIYVIDPFLCRIEPREIDGAEDVAELFDEPVVVGEFGTDDILMVDGAVAADETRRFFKITGGYSKSRAWCRVRAQSWAGCGC